MNMCSDVVICRTSVQSSRQVMVAPNQNPTKVTVITAPRENLRMYLPPETPRACSRISVAHPRSSMSSRPSLQTQSLHRIPRLATLMQTPAKPHKLPLYTHPSADTEVTTTPLHLPQIPSPRPLSKSHGVSSPSRGTTLISIRQVVEIPLALWQP